MKIEYISIDLITPYDKNAKQHPEEQINQIAASIRDYGMNDPVAIWKDNIIIEGHGRLIASKQLGLKKIPVIRLDHLSDKQRRQYTIIHNQLTLNSGFDITVLNEELNSITDIDMEKYGLTVTDILTPDIIEGFYTDAPDKEKEQIQCPFCGEWFEL